MIQVFRSPNRVVTSYICTSIKVEYSWSYLFNYECLYIKELLIIKMCNQLWKYKHKLQMQILIINLINQSKLTFNFASLAIFKISAIFTAFVAASYKSSVKTILKPESEIIFCAYSILVPFILSTIGFFIPRALIPLISPKAMISALL